MGCLLELVLDILFEGTLDFLSQCLLEFLKLFIPAKRIPTRAKWGVKIFTEILEFCLVICLCIGLAVSIQSDPEGAEIGRRIARVAGMAIGTQILLGGPAWAIRHFRNKRRNP